MDQRVDMDCHCGRCRTMVEGQSIADLVGSLIDSSKYLE
jgi:hypothetical protein